VLSKSNVVCLKCCAEEIFTKTRFRGVQAGPKPQDSRFRTYDFCRQHNTSQRMKNNTEHNIDGAWAGKRKYDKCMLVHLADRMDTS
jgi:hypothetical protein